MKLNNIEKVEDDIEEVTERLNIISRDAKEISSNARRAIITLTRAVNDFNTALRTLAVAAKKAGDVLNLEKRRFNAIKSEDKRRNTLKAKK
jgi:prefoldin subunit 5